MNEFLVPPRPREDTSVPKSGPALDALATRRSSPTASNEGFGGRRGGAKMARGPGPWGPRRATGGSGPSLEVEANAPTLPQKAFPESVNSIPNRKTVRESGKRRWQGQSVRSKGTQAPGPTPQVEERRGRRSHAQLQPRLEPKLDASRDLGVEISLRCLVTGRTLSGPQANPSCSLKSPTMGEGGGGGRSCGTTRELQRLKQQAMEYYRENDVPRRLEELLNSTFYLQPADVYGHLVGTWDKHPLPSSPSPPPHAAATPRACAAESRTRAAAAGSGSVVLRGGDPEGRTGAETCAGGISREKAVDRKLLKESRV